jgi:DNA invertase Pin-like site-specific DNA recombinase
MKSQVGLYLRASTSNGQATENQQRELEAVATHSGWRVFGDNGISGAKGRDKRPGFRRSDEYGDAARVRPERLCPDTAR